MQVTKEKDITQILESGKRETLGLSTRRQNQLGITERTPFLRSHLLSSEIDADHLIHNDIDIRLLEECLVSPLQLGQIRHEALRQLRPIDRKVPFIPNHGYRTFI